MRVQRITQTLSGADNLPGVDLSLIDPLIKRYKDTKGRMIPMLQQTQEIYGYLPAPALEKISAEAGLDLSEIFGVATFYAQFRLKPAGKHMIRMCHGTACHVQGVNSITDELLDNLAIKDGETTPDGLFTIETVACLGCCSLAPVMMIGEETYGKLTAKEAVKIVKELRRRESESAR